MSKTKRLKAIAKFLNVKNNEIEILKTTYSDSLLITNYGVYEVFTKKELQKTINNNISLNVYNVQLLKTNYFIHPLNY